VISLEMEGRLRDCVEKLEEIEEEYGDLKAEISVKVEP